MVICFLDGRSKEQMNDTLLKVISNQKQRNTINPSIFVFNDVVVVYFIKILNINVEFDIKGYVIKNMILQDKNEGLFFEILMDEDNKVKNVYFEWMRKEDFSKEEISKYQQESQALAEQRVHKSLMSRQKQKIGRNELCPCGSGKKYKKCHGLISRSL